MSTFWYLAAYLCAVAGILFLIAWQRRTILEWLGAKKYQPLLKKCAKAMKSGESATILAVAVILTIVPIAALFLGSLIFISYVFSGKPLYQVASAFVLLLLAKTIFGLIAKLWTNTVVTTPPVERQIVDRFGKRTGRVLDEGLDFKWFFEGQSSKKVDLKEEPFELEFQVEGENPKIPEWMVCRGRARFRVDPEVKDAQDRSVCSEVEEPKMRSGIIDHILQKLEALGPHFKAQFLKKNQPAIADFLEGYLRLETMPHSQARVDIKDLPDWYSKHRRLVSQAIKQERAEIKKHSEVEKIFGVDIVGLEITYLDYTKDTLRRKQATAGAEADASSLEIRTQRIKALIDAGLSPISASQQVFAAFDHVTPTVTSFEGLGGNGTVVLPTNLFGGTPKRTKDNDEEREGKGGGK